MGVVQDIESGLTTLTGLIDQLIELAGGLISNTISPADAQVILAQISADQDKVKAALTADSPTEPVISDPPVTPAKTGTDANGAAAS